MIYNNQSPYPQNGLVWIDQAMAWALQYSIGVIIDLHRVPDQGNWTGSSSIQNTVAVVEFIAKRYVDHPCLIGIELYNEPAENWGLLRQYYVLAYNTIRAVSTDISVIYMTWGPGTYLYIQNSTTVNLWNDEHYYPGEFGYLDSTTHQGLIDLAGQQLPQETNAYQVNYTSPLYYGEWALNNDATDTAPANFSREYFLAVVRAMKNAQVGWTFWAWKESYGNIKGQNMPWSFYSQIINNNIFPEDYSGGGILPLPTTITTTAAAAATTIATATTTTTTITTTVPSSTTTLSSSSSIILPSSPLLVLFFVFILYLV